MSESTPTALIRQLLRKPDMHLFNVAQADGYTRRIPYLTKLVMPRGALDFGEDLPAQDVQLIGPTVELVARDTLHPALSDLLLEAARDNGATPWQTVLHVVLPLCKTGIIIGSIFVVALVMGDFITVGVMGGQQIASVGKTIQVQANVLQFPAAAANAVVLLAVVLLMIWALMRLVDLRREL